MIRPTQRAVLIAAFGVPISLILVVADERLWPLALAYLGLAVLLAGGDAARALRLQRLRVEVGRPPQLYIGEQGALPVTLTLDRRPVVADIELLCDVGPLLDRPPMQRMRLGEDGRARLDVPLNPKRRGMAEVERLWLRWTGPLGLMSMRRIHEVSAEIPVIPNLRAVSAAAIRFFARDAPVGLKAQRQHGDGSEFESLREYVPGLDPRTIDWKHSARHHELLCKEFRAERNHQIVLAFDTGHLMGEPLAGLPRLDRAINAGLILAYASLRAGDRVGIFGFDSGVRLFAHPLGGLHSFPRLQRLAAQLDYGQEETNFTLGLMDLLGRLHRRSLVILTTEFVDTVTAELMVENLTRLASRHLVLFVTLQDPGLAETRDLPPHAVQDMARSVVAHEMTRERDVVFERLRRLGVLCLDAPHQRVGPDLVNRYLLIKRRELI